MTGQSHDPQSRGDGIENKILVQLPAPRANTGTREVQVIYKSYKGANCRRLGQDKRRCGGRSQRLSWCFSSLSESHGSSKRGPSPLYSPAISAPAASAKARACGDDRQGRFDCRGVKVARSIGSPLRARERDTSVLLPKVLRSPATAICRKQPAPVGLAACPNLLARYRRRNRNHPAYFEDCSGTRQEFSLRQGDYRTSGTHLPNAMFLRLTGDRCGLYPSRIGQENTRRGSSLLIF
jgi:hypothetical protein